MRSVKRSIRGDHIGYGPASRVVKAVHIAPTGEGRWTVSKAGKTRVRKIFSDKTAAMEYVKELKALRSSDVVLHKKDGTIEVGKVAKSGEFTAEPAKSFFGGPSKGSGHRSGEGRSLPSK
jgi:hypothetical protein